MTPEGRIYIADDEAELVALLEEGLEAEGYEVETASDGESLLALVDQRRPDLILLDIAMPGMDGWEVKRELDAANGVDDVPVIAITAQGGSSVEASARGALGFAGFLQKPFRLQVLVDRITSVLDATDET